MAEIRRCPFCGGENLFVGTEADIKCLTESDREIFEEADLDCSFYAVCCDYQQGGCGTVGGFRKTEEEAIELWNRRVLNV